MNLEHITVSALEILKNELTEMLKMLEFSHFVITMLFISQSILSCMVTQFLKVFPAFQ